MSIEYFWRHDDFMVVDNGPRAIGNDANQAGSGVKLSFSEFRDLVQCQARGAVIITSAEGRPQVTGGGAAQGRFCPEVANYEKERLTCNNCYQSRAAIIKPAE